MIEIKTENDENYLTLCRICGTFLNNIIDIFKSANNGKQLDEMLSFCLNQTIYEGDGLPRVICLACESNLLMVYQFHKLATSVKNVAEVKLKVENETCRICGNYSNYFKSEHNVKQLVEMLLFCLNQIKHEDDSLPGIICSACESNLLMAYKFHTLCSKSKRRFQEIAGVSFNNLAKVKVKIVYEPASENEVKVENEALVPVAVSNFSTGSKKNEQIVEYEFKRKGKYSQLPNNKVSSTKRKVICHICGKECNKRYLNYHMQSAHGAATFTCDICNSAHKTKAALRYHILIHSGEKHVCNICEKIFLRKEDLSRHLKIHTGEKSFVCGICQKGFAENNYLSKHMKTHTGEKSHVCKFCDKPFITRTTLLTHERIHTGEKPYSCNFCEKKFASNGGLYTHKKVHTGEKPHMCQVCQLTFKQGSHLKAHQRVHTGERPYVCKVCQFPFSQIGHLIAHQKIHTRKSQLSTTKRTNSSGLQFSCTYCEKAYARKNSLKSHITKCFREHSKDIA